MTRCRREERGELYRSRDGMILGVCKGFAEHLGMNVTAIRILTVALMLLTGFWPLLIMYFVAALLMKPEPAIPFDSDDEKEFYYSYTTSRSMALHRLKQTYDNIERRIQRIEDIVTARDYDWDNRLNH